MLTRGPPPSFKAPPFGALIDEQTRKLPNLWTSKNLSSGIETPRGKPCNTGIRYKAFVPSLWQANACWTDRKSFDFGGFPALQPGGRLATLSDVLVTTNGCDFYPGPFFFPVQTDRAVT